MIRDPKRIPRVLNKLQTVWEQYPDLRLGQVIALLNKSGKDDIFYLEDTVFESFIDKRLDKSEEM